VLAVLPLTLGVNVRLSVPFVRVADEFHVGVMVQLFGPLIVNAAVFVPPDMGSTDFVSPGNPVPRLMALRIVFTVTAELTVRFIDAFAVVVPPANEAF
jgi:hypothetical protein